MTRRQALRRSAALGGALVWSVPVVQSMAGPAVAAPGSPETDVEGVKTGNEGDGRGAPDDDVRVLGEKLPSTGSTAADLAALGVGAVAVGAAMRAAKRRKHDPAEDASA